MIDHAPGETQNARLQLEQATVVGKCECGCPSVDFAIDGKEPPEDSGMQIVREYVYGSEDHTNGAMIFQCGGQLAGIEFYSLNADPVPPDLPDCSSLRLAELHEHP